MEESSSRRLALAILNRYRPASTNLSTLLNAELGRLPADTPHRGFVRDLVWCVVRRLNTLDWFVDAFTTRPERLELSIRNVLRLGIAQLLYFSGRIPEYAAVDETVKLAGASRRPQARGVVNAVLRQFQRRREALPWPDPQDGPLRAFAVRFAHPEWMAERWLARFGEEEAGRLCRADNEPPPLSVRANTLNVTREMLRECLVTEGVEAEPSHRAPDGLRLLSHPEIERLETYREGMFLVQDEASQLIARIVDPRPGETVLDLCAGTGLKTEQLFELSGGKARITAVDLSKAQLAKARENFRRCGVEGVELVEGDARAFGGGVFDRVLVDAPCSGLGVIRRKPDIKWNRAPEDVTARFPALQRGILDHAATLVKPGGVLVYSTCSIEPEEDEGVAESFLADHPGFTREPATPGAGGEALTSGGYLRTWPHRDATDGFFAARFRRTA